jgi:glucokinase
VSAADAAARIGVDLGGTTTRIVALDSSDEVAAQRLVETRSFPAGDPEGVVGRLANLIVEVTGGAPIHGVGIGASGPIDAFGVIRNPDTLPEFSGFDLTGGMSGALRAPCVLENDADVFTLGESRLGAARGARCVVGVTLGTGVGTGVINDGHIHRGGDGEHPEGGHIPTPGPPAPCYCGLEYCWEQRASRTALERLIEARAPGRDVGQVVADAEAGEPVAAELLHEYSLGVGSGLAALATLFRPQTFVIGGGVTPYLAALMDGIREALTRRGPYVITADVVASELGVLAGAIGAATLV